MSDCPHTWLRDRDLLAVDNALHFCAAFTRRTKTKMHLRDLVCCGCEGQAVADQPAKVRALLRTCPKIPDTVGHGLDVLLQYNVDFPEEFANVRGSLWGVRECAAYALGQLKRRAAAKSMWPVSRALDPNTYSYLYEAKLQVARERGEVQSVSVSRKRPASALSTSQRAARICEGVTSRPPGPNSMREWMKKPAGSMSHRQRQVFRAQTKRPAAPTPSELSRLRAKPRSRLSHKQRTHLDSMS
jgi:hypothetical protein